MRNRSNVPGSKRPVAACVRLHVRPSARMNMLKRNLNTARITGKTVACDQCRIKVFGGLRLDTLMGPYRHIPYPHRNSGVSPPGKCEVANDRRYIRVLLVELNV